MLEPIECQIFSGYHYEHVMQDVNKQLKLREGWMIHGELQITSTVNGPLYSILLERFNLSDVKNEFKNLPDKTEK